MAEPGLVQGEVTWVLGIPFGPQVQGEEVPKPGSTAKPGLPKVLCAGEEEQAVPRPHPALQTCVDVPVPAGRQDAGLPLKHPTSLTIHPATPHLHH